MLLLRVVKVAQFFEFFYSKILKQNLKNFADFEIQNQLRVKQLAIIAYTDC